MLILEDLSVRYPKQARPALNNVSFRINEPGLYLFAGKSGSGKSTLARVLFGLIPHIFYAEVKGKVSILGINPVEKGPISLAGKAGFVSQNPEMFLSSILVRDEIVSALSNLAFQREKIIRTLNHLTKELELESLLNKTALELSAGQMQKVAIASSLALDPEILILDEPFARLDNYNSTIILKILMRISARKIILVFEHHLDLILPFAKQVFILDKGNLIFRGDPRSALKYLVGVDLPEITESFLALRDNLDYIPLTVRDALEVIKNYRTKRNMV